MLLLIQIYILISCMSQKIQFKSFISKYNYTDLQQEQCQGEQVYNDRSSRHGISFEEGSTIKKKQSIKGKTQKIIKSKNTDYQLQINYHSTLHIRLLTEKKTYKKLIDEEDLDDLQLSQFQNLDNIFSCLEDPSSYSVYHEEGIIELQILRVMGKSQIKNTRLIYLQLNKEMSIIPQTSKQEDLLLQIQALKEQVQKLKQKQTLPDIQAIIHEKLKQIIVVPKDEKVQIETHQQFQQMPSQPIQQPSFQYWEDRAPSHQLQFKKTQNKIQITLTLMAYSYAYIKYRAEIEQQIEMCWQRIRNKQYEFSEQKKRIRFFFLQEKDTRFSDIFFTEPTPIHIIHQLETISSMMVENKRLFLDEMKVTNKRIEENRKQIKAEIEGLKIWFNSQRIQDQASFNTRLQEIAREIELQKEERNSFKIKSQEKLSEKEQSIIQNTQKQIEKLRGELKDCQKNTERLQFNMRGNEKGFNNFVDKYVEKTYGYLAFDFTTPYCNRFKINGRKIEYLENEINSQFLLRRKYPANPIFKFSCKIVKSEGMAIWIGVCDRKTCHRLRSSFKTQNAISFCGTGYISAGTEGKHRQSTFLVSQTVTVDVNLNEGTMKWVSNNRQLCSVEAELLKRKNCQFVPYIEFFHAGDTVDYWQ